MSDIQKLKLVEPIHDVAGQVIEEISIRVPRAKEMRRAPANPQTLGEILSFASTLTDLPEVTIDKLGNADAVALTRLTAFFLGFGHSTGNG